MSTQSEMEQVNIGAGHPSLTEAFDEAIIPEFDRINLRLARMEGILSENTEIVVRIEGNLSENTETARKIAQKLGV